MTDVGFSCGCGTLKGIVQDASPRSSCHLVCYCRDCRAFARHLGQVDKLEPGGGSPLVQVLPAKIEITQGADQIACLRLSPKGLHRWYAACCNTPLANTVGSPKVPLAGMWRPQFARHDAFGPVVTNGFTKAALPGGPRRDKGLVRMLGGLVRRSLSAYLNGSVRQNPFFDAAGAPVVQPVLISAEDRAAAYRD
ncbi:DUF6151 family protein [uncultured Roseobacter sp.]|uniref:DUF6151 family protein n=1 Tax=uncultured Roseobacter sp. TaxID=114847 RepID=UPI00261D9226|nr:DUF6151 family protein [uncultured Roseobacter sp.]